MFKPLMIGRKNLKLMQARAEAATLTEEAEHTEAENIKLADRETKEEKKSRKKIQIPMD